jgi:hypothetical protein
MSSTIAKEVETRLFINNEVSFICTLYDYLPVYHNLTQQHSFVPLLMQEHSSWYLRPIVRLLLWVRIHRQI